MKIALVLLGLLFALTRPAFAGLDEGIAAYERQNWPLAAAQLKPLADKDVAPALGRYGWMEVQGWGVPRAVDDGLRLLRRGIDAGDAEAMYLMAGLYRDGSLGLPKDIATRGVLLDRAADLGHPEALSVIGTEWLFGINRATDQTKAIGYLTQAAMMGSASGAEFLGVAYLNGLGVPRDPAQAVQWLRLAADKERPVSQSLLGDRYWNGQGVALDHAEANRWYQKAAAHGSLEGMTHFGMNLIEGDGAARDVNKGVALLTEAANKGFEPAAEQLGLMFWGGNEVQRDHPRAIGWLRIAAKSRIKAQLILGAALWDGDGVPADHAAAVAVFRLAAAQGNAEAQYRLAQALAQGDGTPKDLAQAFVWAQHAADAPVKEPQKQTYQRARDQILAQLTPSEIPQTAPPQPVAVQPVPPQIRKATIGSGFVINSMGAVMTDAHVVASCKHLRVILTDTNQSNDATITAVDPVNDLAVLQTPLTRIPAVTFREDKPIRAGDGVVVIGYPLSGLLSREPNVTTGVVSAMAGLRGDLRYYQITAPVQKGNSGGPAADMSGNVVGVIQSKLDAMSIQQRYADMPENVNFATKGDLVRKFLNENAINYRTGPAKEALSAADVAERIKQSMVLVECEL